MKHITKRLYIHRIDWTGEPPTYEVREPGQGTADDYEPGATLGVFNTRAEAQAFVTAQQEPVTSRDVTKQNDNDETA